MQSSQTTLRTFPRGESHAENSERLLLAEVSQPNIRRLSTPERICETTKPTRKHTLINFQTKAHKRRAPDEVIRRRLVRNPERNFMTNSSKKSHCCALLLRKHARNHAESKHCVSNHCHSYVSFACEWDTRHPSTLLDYRRNGAPNSNTLSWVFGNDLVHSTSKRISCCIHLYFFVFSPSSLHTNPHFFPRKIFTQYICEIG